MGAGRLGLIIVGILALLTLILFVAAVMVCGLPCIDVR
jgi:hypothetical protein